MCELYRLLDLLLPQLPNRARPAGRRRINGVLIVLSLNYVVSRLGLFSGAHALPVTEPGAGSAALTPSSNPREHRPSDP